ncbi:hypothetical protein LSAT2_014513 [Lamellibrachia satsuma]|nr:hypothetical protein LSAT2_014513 [Lamellibrachia satsuma]
MGVTRASRQSFGAAVVENNCCTTNASIGDSSREQFLRKTAQMSSGPDAVSGEMLPSSFVTLGLEITMRASSDKEMATYLGYDEFVFSRVD